MSNLDKLRQKRLLRQAADSSFNALLDGPSVVPLPDPPSTAHGPTLRRDADTDGFGRNLVSDQGMPGGSSRHSKDSASRAGELPPKRPGTSIEVAVSREPPTFTAHGPCPVSALELRECILRFMCGSAAFGPLPISGVGLNAALRREYLRAGHTRSEVAIFRSTETIGAVRRIQDELRVVQCPEALVLDSSAGGEDDLLIVDTDTRRLFSILLAPELANASLPKRFRHSSGFESSGQGMWYPSAASGLGDRASETLVSMLPEAGSGSGGCRGAAAADASVDELLSAPTAKQRQLMDAGAELRKLLAEPTTRQSLTAQKFMNKSKSMAQFCPNGSRSDCCRFLGSSAACSKIHFKKIIKPWTDESLGDCSYLDTCRHIEKCKYVHYSLDLTVGQAQLLNDQGVQNRGTDTKRINELAMKGTDTPAQWVHCDLRKFPLDIFNGQISVVMADPPWDIHMELPYGTLTDDEVRNLNVGDIHEDGVIFLWVTGRAMELARDCFRIWGYRRIEEIIWVKTNQLQRIIRTGRTGHWINHSKEHCLVGIKGNPKLNRNLDCDVIVSEVRETSRKPDEIYNLIERMFPNCLKLELFGRPHNVHDNWITCGNQLDGVRLCDETICRRYNERFPNAKVEPWRKEQEAIVPVSVVGGWDSRGGNATEDSPWIPPMSAPSTMQPSSRDAWVPPGQPAPPGAPLGGQAGWGWPR
mmetsp:Transcript_152623/g.489421  ORF Transcript_152623/g.489421 Transcript_152623/m.489421 type:complete len:700 (+) Transcript_152623:97-2196(+)